MTESGVKHLYVIPGQNNVHTFSFLPHHEDVGKSLEVCNLSSSCFPDSGVRVATRI